MMKLGIKAEEVGGSSQPLPAGDHDDDGQSDGEAAGRGAGGRAGAASSAERVIGGGERAALEQGAAVTHHVTHGGLKHRRGGMAAFDGVVAGGEPSGDWAAGAGGGRVRGEGGDAGASGTAPTDASAPPGGGGGGGGTPLLQALVGGLASPMSALVGGGAAPGGRGGTPTATVAARRRK